MIFCFNFNHFLYILSYRFIIVEKSKLKKYKVLIHVVVTWKYKVTVVCIKKGKKGKIDKQCYLFKENIKIKV